MKLPFSKIISPVLKPYLGDARMFCEHPIFGMSLQYAYAYGTLGFFVNANGLRTHFAELPTTTKCSDDITREYMLFHDLKILATSMGLAQYACLIIGCFTENPALFLPHLAGQLVIIIVKVMNLFLLITHINLKSLCKLKHKVPAVMLLTFNWCQEFCVFRQYLCVCDLE